MKIIQCLEENVGFILNGERSAGSAAGGTVGEGGRYVSKRIVG